MTVKSFIIMFYDFKASQTTDISLEQDSLTWYVTEQVSSHQEPIHSTPPTPTIDFYWN